MLWGNLPLWEAGGKSSPVSGMLTVNMPRLCTALPGASEMSGNVRNGHSASDGVIPPEEAEGRAWVSDEFRYCLCFICRTACFCPTNPVALGPGEDNLRNKG